MGIDRGPRGRTALHYATSVGLLVVVSFYNQFSLWFTQEYRTLFSNQHIFLQTQIAITRGHQSGLKGKDLADLNWPVGRVAVTFPFRTKQRAAVVACAAHLMARAVHELRITSVGHHLARHGVYLFTQNTRPDGGGRGLDSRVRTVSNPRWTCGGGVSSPSRRK